MCADEPRVHISPPRQHGGQVWLVELLSRSCRRIHGQSSLLLGRLWLVLGRPKNAKKAFQEVLKQRGEHFGAYVQLGRLALEEGNLPTAQKELSAAQKTNPLRFARLEEKLIASLRPGDHRPGDHCHPSSESSSKLPWADPVLPTPPSWFIGWFTEKSHASAGPAEEANDIYPELDALDTDVFNWDEDAEAISTDEDELPLLNSPWGETRGPEEEDNGACTEAPLQSFYQELARGEALADEGQSESDELQWEVPDDGTDATEFSSPTEHEKFAALPPIAKDEIEQVNWEELAFRLIHWESD